PLFFFSSRRRHTRSKRDWSSDVCSSDLVKFISASEPQYTFSSPECRHSTLYMEKRAVEGEPTVFSETFEFTANGEWHNLKPEDRSEERRVGKEGRGEVGREGLKEW